MPKRKELEPPLASSNKTQRLQESESSDNPMVTADPGTRSGSTPTVSSAAAAVADPGTRSSSSSIVSSASRVKTESDTSNTCILYNAYHGSTKIEVFTIPNEDYKNITVATCGAYEFSTADEVQLSTLLAISTTLPIEIISKLFKKDNIQYKQAHVKALTLAKCSSADKRCIDKEVCDIMDNMYKFWHKKKGYKAVTKSYSINSKNFESADYGKVFGNMNTGDIKTFFPLASKTDRFNNITILSDTEITFEKVVAQNLIDIVHYLDILGIFEPTNQPRAKFENSLPTLPTLPITSSEWTTWRKGKNISEWKTFSRNTKLKVFYKKGQNLMECKYFIAWNILVYFQRDRPGIMYVNYKNSIQIPSGDCTFVRERSTYPGDSVKNLLSNHLTIHKTSITIRNNIMVQPFIVYKYSTQKTPLVVKHPTTKIKFSSSSAPSSSSSSSSASSSSSSYVLICTFRSCETPATIPNLPKRCYKI